MNKNRRKNNPPVEEVKESLVKKFQDFPYFQDVEIKGKGINSILVIIFSEEPPFKFLMEIPLSYKGYYIKTKIGK